MADEVLRAHVLRDTYRDSGDLMRVADEVGQCPDVRRAALLMATPANRDLLAKAGLLAGEATAAGPALLHLGRDAHEVDRVAVGVPEHVGAQNLVCHRTSRGKPTRSRRGTGPTLRPPLRDRQAMGSGLLFVYENVTP